MGLIFHGNVGAGTGILCDLFIVIVAVEEVLTQFIGVLMD